MSTRLEYEKRIELERLCREIRYSVVQLSHRAKSAHLGSCLSCIDILVVLYFKILNIDRKSPKMLDRDIFILSKGHAAMAIYSVLSAKGFFSDEDLLDFNNNGGVFPEHPPARGVKGIEVATGSLGHGLPIAVGNALGLKMRRSPNQVYTLLSDGENNEGSIWEAAMFASSNKLTNLTVFIDNNKWQATGRSDQILNSTPLTERWRAFGWEVLEIDGHNLQEIIRACTGKRQKPRAIVADTIKGKGISFMEDDNNWHYRIPTLDEVDACKRELLLS